jgi:hypothetical protein
MNPNLRFHLAVAKVHSAIPIHIDMTDHGALGKTNEIVRALTSNITSPLSACGNRFSNDVANQSMTDGSDGSSALAASDHMVSSAATEAKTSYRADARTACCRASSAGRVVLRCCHGGFERAAAYFS